MRLGGVAKRYGRRTPWILRDVDLTVSPGELVRVEGPNGSGKSTLLRLVAGIERADVGEVEVGGRRAYVPERFPPALPFPARGYLRHLGRIHGLPKDEADRRAGYWLERFGIAERGGTAIAKLSKGTCQKVAVAQALLAEADVLLLDEAWTGLDQAARAELDDAVAERVAAGGQVLFVDHDPNRLAGLTTSSYAVEAEEADPGAGVAPRRSRQATEFRAAEDRALVRYYMELLLRSQRWLPPVLAYVLLLVVGMSAGEEAFAALAFSGAVLVPVAAWLVRCAVTAEPPASRACVVAAVGPVRAHVGALLAALLASSVLGALGLTAVLLTSGHAKSDRAWTVPAGLLITAVCVLTGVGIGALFNRPTVLSAQYGIPLGLAAATLALVTPGSPVNAVVGALIAGAQKKGLHLPVFALPGALLFAALALAAAALLAGRRQE